MARPPRDTHIQLDRAYVLSGMAIATLLQIASRLQEEGIDAFQQKATAGIMRRVLDSRQLHVSHVNHRRKT